MSSVPVRRARATTSPAPAAGPAALAFCSRGQEVVIPASAHTLAGFRAWAVSEEFPEYGRISFLDQEIFIDMSPEELETHSKVKLEMTRALANWNKKTKRGELYPDGVLLTNVEANLSTEADAAFASWETLEAGRVRLIPREGKEDQYIEMEGTPDWVLEVVSQHSVRKDTKRLRQQYHRAGIPEYWLIDARGEEIDFRVLTWAEKGYEAAAAGRGGWRASRVFGRRFRLVRRRGRMGFWEYTLQGKPVR